MIVEVMPIGSKTVIDYSDEHPSNGMVVTIKRFSEIHYGRTGNFGYEPGFYPNHSWVYVEDEQGKEKLISSCHLKPCDEEEYEKLVDDWRKKDRLRELPETDFVEGDILSFKDKSRGYEGEVFVQSIDYGLLGKFCNDDVTPYPVYLVTPVGSSGQYMYTRPDDVDFVRRGKIWHYYNGDKVEFENIDEEARFFGALGHTEEVRNPYSEENNFSWTLEEALKGIRERVVDAMSVSDGLFGSSPSTHCIKYRDEDLGEQVSKYVLANFSEQVLTE